MCLGQIDCWCADGDAEARAEQAAAAEEEGAVSEMGEQSIKVNRDMVRVPCVRCGRTVHVPKEDLEEDPQGLVTCDECWPLLQKEMLEGLPQHPEIVDDSLPL